MPGTVVLLHGFAGTRRAWDAVVEQLEAESYTALAPDIRGHGESSSLRPITFDACSRDVLDLAPERFDLCGYSMGGRLALHMALAAPGRVRRLVLVSTTAGIDHHAERAARRTADRTLADELERGTIAQFAERWLAQPLFAADGPASQSLAREDILRNGPHDLSAALRGIGAGEMAPLWQRLGELRETEVVVVVGERDVKFAAIGERLAQAIPGARLVTIEGAGHALPREAPAPLAAVIADR